MGGMGQRPDAGQPVSIHIIAGRCRGRRLRTLPGTALRPTPGAVRETLFNWLASDIIGARVLDLFAGSGALGLEALSRGAGEVVFVEKNPRHRQVLQENVTACGAGQTQIVGSDALGFLRDCGQSFDVILADPPFHQGWPARLAPLFFAGRCLSAQAMIYLESAASEQWPVTALPVGWSRYRSGHCGDSHYALFQRFTEERTHG
ncbi:16S rRNA (guanine(966)-N(2))-methyltransferase RsmD [Acidithiobacillus sp.]